MSAACDATGRVCARAIARHWMSSGQSPHVDLLAAVAALGRALQEKFDPLAVLSEFSRLAKPIVPHDRVVIFRLAEDGLTFTVFAELDPRGLRLHRGFWSTSF